jgi:cation-transporting P-type ATPase E
VPNGLFLSISVTYALAAVRIIRHGVLVQQSNAIESLSNVDTLCRDKTRTLTANRLRGDGIQPLSPLLSGAELGHVLGVMVASAGSGNNTTRFPPSVVTVTCNTDRCIVHCLERCGSVARQV